MNIPFVDLGGQHQPLKEEILNAIAPLLDSGQFILGEPVEKFEAAFAEFCRTKYAIGVGNGTDALILAMKALGIGPGDEVITAPNSFLASASAIALAGAKIVFADVGRDMNLDPVRVRKAITSKTKAIMPVHLTGRPANMDEILKIAGRFGLQVIEDAAQAVGAEYDGNRVGGLGTLGAFSLHPLKNLNACGDGGVITTNDPDLAAWLKKARNHGLKNRDECSFWSQNSRLDTLQAAILSVKLQYLDQWNARRKEIANQYNKQLLKWVVTPEFGEHLSPVFHTYIIQTHYRDQLQTYLAEKGVETKIHYPIPIHQQEAYLATYSEKGSFPETERQSREILSLPVYPQLTDEQVDYVIECVRGCFEGK